MSVPTWDDIRRDTVWRSNKTGRRCTVMLDVAGIWDEVLLRTESGRTLKRRVPVFLDQYQPEKTWLARRQAEVERGRWLLLPSVGRLNYRNRKPGKPSAARTVAAGSTSSES